MVARSANLRCQTVQTPASGLDEIADKTGSPLGNAEPFEYMKSATGNDVLSIAARGVSEAHEADCFSEYKIDMQQCDALAFHLGGARMSTLCKQNAFDRYQQCRGY
ncbi:hypothetical protein ASG35_20945 [Burkholderia sp. Leaf177]|nr:hypothetical protein ASG35_20945 [Burkholderia sp. Leaf177]